MVSRMILGAAALATLAACASSNEPVLTSVDSIPPKAVTQTPAAIDLPPVSELDTPARKKRVSGTRAPNKGEMQGTTWVTEFDPNSDYVVPVGTADAGSLNPAQMTLVTFPGAVFSAITPAQADQVFAASVAGNTVAIQNNTPKTGIEMRLFVTFGSTNGTQTAKLIGRAVGGLGLSELRFTVPEDEAKQHSAAGADACARSEFSASTMHWWAPRAACTVYDPAGAGTATWLDLPDVQPLPTVAGSGGGQEVPVRYTVKRQSNGVQRYRIQGDQRQLVLRHADGSHLVLTRRTR